MNSIAESSFFPLDYYNKLTNCLANRKNLKFHLREIPGATKKRHCQPVLFTDRKIQTKFLTKYRLKRQAEKQQGAAAVTNNIGNDLVKIKNNPQILQNNKRNRSDESYINLPDSYFKSRPNLSLFKIPAIPPTKQLGTDIPNSIKSNNFTLASLFSGHFNPPQHSTPIELPKIHEDSGIRPIIIDPEDILTEPVIQQELQPQEKEIRNLQSIDNQFISYKDSIDNAAKYIDSICFDKTDPIKMILKDLNGKYEEATQSPRESMVSNTPKITQKDSQSLFENETIEQHKITKSWPKPVFYDQPKEKSQKEMEPSEYGDNDDHFFLKSFYEHSGDLFVNDLDDDGDSYFKCDDNLRKNLIPPSTQSTVFFDTPNIWKSSPGNLFNSTANIFLTPSPFSSPKQKNNLNELWLNEECNTSSKIRNDGLDWKDEDFSILSDINSIDLNWLNEELTDSPKERSNHDDLDWLEEKFNKQMSWDHEDNFNLFNKERTDGAKYRSRFSDIFRSPLKSNMFDVEKSFSRTISRPKKLFHQYSDEGYWTKQNDSFWSESNKIDGNLITPMIPTKTQNLFDTTFSLF